MAEDKDKIIEFPADVSKTAEVTFAAKRKMLFDFCSHMAPDSREFKSLFVSAIGTLYLEDIITTLWYEYNKEPTEELKLIFNSYDVSDTDKTKKEITTYQQILSIALTGKSDADLEGKLTQEIFPAGFWKLPALEKALVDGLLVLVSVIATEAVSALRAAPKDDSDEPEYASQLDMLMLALTEALVDTSPDDEPEETPETK